MDRFTRVKLLIGEAKWQRLNQSRVTVIGLGAVGSYAVEALARGGVGHLRLVDFDTIRASNINRQLFALESTVGKTKPEVAARRVKDINPDCVVEPLEIFAAEDSFNAILDNQPHLVIDAIDAVNPKVQLLTALHQRGVPMIASMGAAVRTDPAAIRFGDLFSTKNCPLAKVVRYRLKRRGINSGIPCVYSEEPDYQSKYPSIREENPEDAYQRGRKRQVLGSLPTITGIFGLTVGHKAMEMLCAGFER
ncbi:MAG: tRNA threonylcarbamoyladenosine dehydratase [Candidatus Omnitrophica bacterium]|nr:tRNA threonylcarbamoyladenosine dehydratase [Candidatus Omnitrophota bacterium]